MGASRETSEEKPDLTGKETVNQPPEQRRGGLAGFFENLFNPKHRPRMRKRVKTLEAQVRQLETRLENTNSLAASLVRDIERLYKTNQPASASAAPEVVRSPESGAQLYCAFENEFRGDTATIAGRQAAYLPLVLKASAACTGKPVLDIGCGRGEFLQLLHDNHVASLGVDIDAAMVERCRARGLNVEHGDFASALNSGKDGDLAGVVAFQLVEHIGYEHLVELIRSANARTAPGGVIILETVNPANFTALRDFYLDPTHRNPIPAATLEFLVRSCGYREVVVQYMSHTPPDRQLKGSDSNTAKLNKLLFGPRDYAVIGWR
jgi:O-antigen chain-terminating methyltransferase